MSISRAQLEEEKSKWGLKYFDYAEAPIKQWIALYLHTPVEQVFTDYDGDQDFISVESNGNFYNLYLTTVPPEKELSLDIFKEQEKLQHAGMILFQAVQTVYTPVVETMSEKKLNNIIPSFDQEKLCFSFHRINSLKAKKDQALHNLQMIMFQMERINNPDNIKEDAKEEVAKIKDQLQKLMIEETVIINSITDEQIAQEEALCNEFNETSHPLLYYAIRTKEDLDDEDILKKMADVGERYRDPDDSDDSEENLDIVKELNGLTN